MPTSGDYTSCLSNLSQNLTLLQSLYSRLVHLQSFQVIITFSRDCTSDVSGCWWAAARTESAGLEGWCATVWVLATVSVDPDLWIWFDSFSLLLLSPAIKSLILRSCSIEASLGKTRWVSPWNSEKLIQQLMQISATELFVFIANSCIIYWKLAC